MNNLNNSRFLVENIALAVLARAALYVSWGLRIGVFSLFAIRESINLNEANKHSELATQARSTWFWALALNMFIYCVDSHCEPPNTQSVLGLAQSTSVIAFLLLGFVISDNASKRYGWWIFGAILAFQQLLYYSSTPCYSTQRALMNDCCYWVTVTTFRAMFDNSKPSYALQRAQNITTFSILFSSNLLTTSIAMGLTFVNLLRWHCNAEMSDTWSGDSYDTKEDQKL